MILRMTVMLSVFPWRREEEEPWFLPRWRQDLVMEQREVDGTAVVAATVWGLVKMTSTAVLQLYHPCRYVLEICWFTAGSWHIKPVDMVS